MVVWLLWYTADKIIQELGRCACCCVSHLFGQKVDLRMVKRLYQPSWMGKRYQLSRKASACNFSRAMYFCDLFLFTEQITWQQAVEGGKKLSQLLHRFKQSHYICCCLSCLSFNTLLVDNAATCCTPPWSLSLPSADQPIVTFSLYTWLEFCHYVSKNRNCKFGHFPFLFAVQALDVPKWRILDRKRTAPIGT